MDYRSVDQGEDGGIARKVKDRLRSKGWCAWGCAGVGGGGRG